VSFPSAYTNFLDGSGFLVEPREKLVECRFLVSGQMFPGSFVLFSEPSESWTKRAMSLSDA